MYIFCSVDIVRKLQEQVMGCLKPRETAKHVGQYSQQQRHKTTAPEQEKQKRFGDNNQGHPTAQ